MLIPASESLGNLSFISRVSIEGTLISLYLCAFGHPDKVDDNEAAKNLKTIFSNLANITS